MANIVTGYQTLEDRDNIDFVEQEGPFQCTRNDAWLSYGYYFWDSNMHWAIEWGQNSFKRWNKEYVVASCGIDLSQKCFDLFGSVTDITEFMKIVEVMRQSGKIKANHRVTVPNVIRYMESKNIFPFKSIRAADNPGRQERFFFSTNISRNEYMILNQRVQICVKQKNGVVLPPFNVIYPEKYRE